MFGCHHFLMTSAVLCPVELQSLLSMDLSLPLNTITKMCLFIDVTLAMNYK